VHGSTIVRSLSVTEVSGALKLLDLLELSGSITPEEAAHWRTTLAAWGVFHPLPDRRQEIA
jgi:hypothetical protein